MDQHTHSVRRDQAGSYTIPVVIETVQFVMSVSSGKCNRRSSVENIPDAQAVIADAFDSAIFLKSQAGTEKSATSRPYRSRLSSMSAESGSW